MTFVDREISSDDSQPVGLYKLEWGPTVWAYTSAEREIVRQETDGQGVVREVRYQPVSISDSGMTQGGSAANDFTVDIQADVPIVDLFRSTPPSESIWLTVRRKHVGEEEALVSWIGTVANVTRTDEAQAQVVGRSLGGSFKRTGLRLCWSVNCPFFLYDSNCRVDKAAFRVDAEIVTVDGVSATVDSDDGKDDGWFRGGIIEWEASEDGTLERRMIESHEGDRLVIFGSTDRLEAGIAVALYPGCARTSEVCEEKFDNLSNHGGFEFMPTQSPFGTQIF